MKKPDTTCILGVNIAITNIQDATEYIISQLNDIRGRYICLSNAHTTVISRKNPNYCRVQNDAFLALPDGSPLVLVQRLRGFSKAERVAGPDIMPAIWKATEHTKWKHFFYGGSPETIKALERNLREKYPGLNIAGMESPPYRPLTEEEDAQIVEKINMSGADFLWVGLGAPKQENWMKAHQNKIQAVMLGVGAGFDFHAGTVKRAPKWMQEHYLEWAYRLLQDPRRLWKRYVVTNFQFIAWCFREMIRKS